MNIEGQEKSEEIKVIDRSNPKGKANSNQNKILKVNKNMILKTKT